MDRFHLFPWQEQEAVRGGPRVPRPMVHVYISCNGTSTPLTPALIDTGAPVTVFPRAMADLLDLELESLRAEPPEKIKLLGEDWEVASVTTTLELPPFSDLTWDAEVRFVLDDGLLFGLLGYEGFLNRWVVTFNAYHGYTVVETLDSFQSRLPVDAEQEFYKTWPDIY